MRDIIDQKLVKLYNENVYYANVFFRLARVEDSKCPTMGVGYINKKWTLVYNKDFVNTLTNKQFIEVLKHESLHLINNHCVVKNFTPVHNIAMDMVINQHLDQSIIEELKGVTIDRYCDLVKDHISKKDLLLGQTWQYYYQFLKKEVDSRKDGMKDLLEKLKDMQLDDHGNFGNEELNESLKGDLLDQVALDYILNEAKKDTMSSCGNLPSEIEDMYKIIKKPKLNWKRLIKQFIGDSKRSERITTRSKRNRRFGLLVAGTKKDYKSNILVALDTSGSMGGTRTDKVLSEIYGIYKAMKNFEIDICELDCEIKDVFKYDGKSEFKISGRGGTDMKPALEYAKNNNYDGVILLTDGEFYNEDFTQYKNIHSLWVIAENKKYKSPIGKTVHVD